MLSQGVRQGSVLSPYLYNIYTEDILKEIRDLNIGTFLDPGINTSIIAFADDLILLSPSLKHLQQMLSLCESYGQATGLKFNSKKTQFVVSEDCPFQHPTIIINDEEVKPQSTLKHLGFLWDTKLRKNHPCQTSGESHFRIVGGNLFIDSQRGKKDASQYHRQHL